ncbi:hypothetical protein BY458DRAFT_492940 [Sporodiniella umbellata]|nr:hypothetical protein BY458DRAFT_492940 [Sporodiniella umbellata]
MDIKNLLNEAGISSPCESGIVDEFPTSPIMAWSSASSVSSAETLVTSIAFRKTKTQQQTRTPWTASEDYLLEKGYMQGLSWAMISAKYLPHRSRGCCWGRFKTLRTKMSQKKRWSMNEDQVLLNSIKKHTHLFEHAWSSVALDLNNRDWRECKLRSTRINLSHPNLDQMSC